MVFLRQALRDTSAAAAVVLALAAPVAAQGVTGTISGTVNDAQGLVVPGATITLISGTRGTASAPVVTNGSGGFVFPNVTADTYTIQVEMPSFRTLRRAGVSVSSGSIVALRRADDSSRRHGGSGDRHRRGALAADGQR